MESKSESASTLGIVRYSQLIIVIIANLQIDMKLISAPVETRNERTREETTSWPAASPRRQQLEKLVFYVLPLAIARQRGISKKERTILVGMCIFAHFDIYILS